MLKFSGSVYSFYLCTFCKSNSYVWRRGLVVDPWLWEKEVWGSSPGCARSMLSPWERLFTCISSPH